MPDKPSFQVIVLGPTGGPREDNVTGILVRSISTKWTPNSVVAVDAGTMLAGIIRLLDKYIPGSKDEEGILQDGPFKGLEMPHETAQANAAYVFREIIGAVLITHPHLDHISGLAINTPILEAGSGPKPVAALPSVLSALKNHMFNDVIWPNLSDEDGGAGLLTYQRLVEGGNPRFGNGEARGYVRACNGLLTKCLSVSHGRCKQRFHPESAAHHRVGSAVFGDQLMLPSRAISVDNTDGSFYSPARSPRILPNNPKESIMATVESSAFFLRDHRTGHEIIVFGDVEPDSVAQEPQNKRVWETAAPKVASGILRAIFIECSYTDAVNDAYLYGHLCPRHLIAELKVLAKQVMDIRDANNADLKRKRDGTGLPDSGTEVSPRTKRVQSIAGQKGRKADATSEPRAHSNLRDSVDYISDDPMGLGFIEGVDPLTEFEIPNPVGWVDADPLPLAGLPVYIIHIKESMTDGPPIRDQILKELQAHSKEAHLGCEFFMPDPAEGIWI
ncbi:Cyclic-AMP phosphodiesterase class-II [Penicillium atrosanguineum]|uniref:Cyclic-AMP phosphodiesterase class-II n=1 Tax=Penicillium atrosanguineum TaxID=1132637 RepID=A0A9W9KY87_9EURO|nr:Acyl-CoA dehydrogenase N-terminal [Penicillium atrosanguineum]KAJ5126769.1 Cyclic-AMP phosphodiesterase class-II [Penicillium atrosanguineum]KAJ5314544.1 Acyl-CoA dehydrogenase N-terminal [Penicillium atrosanguineum]KAJ5331715.1 Cyclic-AMP phosphodiesterase class-II [Penicillium atrosanguineum]